MIRTAAVSRPIRIGTAALGVAGALALAGCSAPVATEETETPTATAAPQPTATTTPAPAASEPAASTSTYTNGTYTADGSYATPESVETIAVTITLEEDIITAVEVSGDPQKSESAEYQGRFIGGIADEVVGKNIDEISVSRVAGSSLTSGGFNEAIAAIRSDAQ